MKNLLNNVCEFLTRMTIFFISGSEYEHAYGNVKTWYMRLVRILFMVPYFIVYAIIAVFNNVVINGIYYVITGDELGKL